MLFLQVYFPPNAFLRQRRKKALLRVNDREGGWKMCILALRRVCVCTYVRAGTSAVNLRRYGNTPQTITIHDLVEILRGTRDDYIFMSLVLFTISTAWFNDIDNNHSILSCYP